MSFDPLTLPPGYYAAPDPDDPAIITCWRRATVRAEFGPWQRGMRYGPAAGVRRTDVPTDAQARQEFMADLRARAMAWYDRVYDVIGNDPDAARQLFASFTTRCCRCGRKLTDPESKLLGIGPECRRGAA